MNFVHDAVRTFSRARCFGLLVGLLLVSAAAVEARPYQLSWDPNLDGVTTGYRVYYGTASGAYQPSQGVDAGNVQQFTVDLTPGMSYYFVVRAYDASGVMSPPSRELRFTVPVGASVGVNTASASPGATITATITGGPGGLTDWVGFFPSGAPRNGWSDWKYLNGSRSTPAIALTGGTVSFVAPNAAGNYEVRFYSDSNVLLASSVPISVGGGSPSVTAQPSSVYAGQTITVAVANGPGSRDDMVALYPSSSTSPSAYIDWKYLNGSQYLPASGTANANVNFIAPTQSGQYFVRFMRNDGTALATSGTITVTGVTAVSVTPSVTTLAAGSSLIAQIANGPAGRYDWVGLFAVGASNSASVARFYLNGSLTPPATGVSSANVPFSVPMQAGQFNLRFFPNDGTTPTATSVTITVSSVTPPPSTGTTLTPSATSVLPGGNVTAQVRNGPAGRLDWVALIPTGASNMAFVEWFYLNGTKVAPATGAASANVVFKMQNLGQYTMRLFANNSYTVLATGATITVADTVTGSPPPSTNATITPSAKTVAPGSLMNVTIANGSGTRLDWIGIYLSGQTGANFVDWTYLNGTKVAPATGLQNTTLSLRVPSDPGTYVMRFYTNNSYTLLATSVNIVVQ